MCLHPQVYILNSIHTTKLWTSEVHWNFSPDIVVQCPHTKCLSTCSCKQLMLSEVTLRSPWYFVQKSRKLWSPTWSLLSTRRRKLCVKNSCPNNNFIKYLLIISETRTDWQQYIQSSWNWKTLSNPHKIRFHWHQTFYRNKNQISSYLFKKIFIISWCQILSHKK